MKERSTTNIIVSKKDIPLFFAKWFTLPFEFCFERRNPFVWVSKSFHRDRIVVYFVIPEFLESFLGCWRMSAGFVERSEERTHRGCSTEPENQDLHRSSARTKCLFLRHNYLDRKSVV